MIPSSLHEGSSLIKHGRTGSPHARLFKLSLDFHCLFWLGSKRKSIGHCTVFLSDIDKVQIGQDTPVFARNRTKNSEDVSRSFSLISASRSLDLVCESIDQCKMWTSSLSLIIGSSFLFSFGFCYPGSSS